MDIWLCGHEHINLDETVTTPDGGTAYVIESGYYLQNVSLIELECFTDENNEFSGFELTHTVLNEEDAEAYARDPEMTALLNEINDEQEEILNTVVGQTPEYLDGDWYNLRIGETNLGRVVADAYLLETGADVAFENAGGIRASIKAGDVTYGDIIGVSPYGNYIVTIESGEPISKTSHTYKDGICTVCKAKNPSANPSEKEKTDTQDSAASPKTGDENHAGVFGAMLLLSAMTIVAFRKKKSMVS